MTTKDQKPSKPAKTRSSLPPNLLVAGRILRHLEPLTIESKRTVLHFIHQSIEEENLAQQRVYLNEAVAKPQMDFERSGLAKNGTGRSGLPAESDPQ